MTLANKLFTLAINMHSVVYLSEAAHYIPLSISFVKWEERLNVLMVLETVLHMERVQREG